MGKLEGRLEFLQRPGAWFWSVVSAGLLIRLLWVVASSGTYDVNLWEGYAEGVSRDGLVAYYHATPRMNHPPLVSYGIAGLWMLSELLGIPFRVALRIPSALFDAGSALLLLHLLRHTRYRWLAVAGYWLSPLTLIYSSFHGNVDSAVAFFLLLTVSLLSSGRVGLAGAALGASLSVKLAGAIAAPLLCLSLPDWRQRFRFAAAAAGVGLLPYLPTALHDAQILLERVFGYSGEVIVTPSGIRIWGLYNFFWILTELPEGLKPLAGRLTSVYFSYNLWICLGLVLLYAFLRRGRSTTGELAHSMNGSLALLYGFTNTWAFQYFAWGIPFWFLDSLSFAAAATLLAGGYVYGAYAFFCGDPLLLGAWDFKGHPVWPWWLLWLRNGAILFFLGVGTLRLTRAAREEFRRLRSQAGGGAA